MGKFNLIAGLIGFGLFATSAIQAQTPTPKANRKSSTQPDVSSARTRLTSIR